MYCRYKTFIFRQTKWQCSHLVKEGKEGNVLFNDALNTFYLRLYGVEHIVKNHSDCERENLLPPHGLTFRLAARVLLYAPSHRPHER